MIAVLAPLALIVAAVAAIDAFAGDKKPSSVATAAKAEGGEAGKEAKAETPAETPVKAVKSTKKKG